MDIVKDKTAVDEDQRKDDELDEGLEESFPASDPPAETQPRRSGAENTPEAEGKPYGEEAERSETATGDQVRADDRDDPERQKSQAKKTQRTE